LPVKAAKHARFEVRPTLLARVDATLESDEYRVDLIRDALKRELERREAARKTAENAFVTPE
jgi:metal-responsive CopG/Arc/MetJ family transcriptional regulator